MALQERREREKEEMKEKILSAASAIVREEGYENLSIRKIANKIEYSPTIIYHYFVDKDEIIYYLMQRGYRKIVQAITCANSTSDTPEGHLKDMTRNYIDVALKMPDEYMSAQLSKSPKVIKHTSMLYKGASENKPIIGALQQCVKQINKDINVDDDKCEIIAQCIIVSTMGLVIKLIVENGIDDEHRNRLIEHFVNETVLKIAKGE